MYKRILAGIDGSPHAEHALAHAVGLAKALGAKLRVVHVVDMGWLPAAPELGIDIGRLRDARCATAEKLVAAAVDRARMDGVEAEAHVVETGTPVQHTATALVEEATSWGADVVVLGARGRSGIERLLLGSVAAGVAGRSTVPVILAP